MKTIILILIGILSYNSQQCKIKKEHYLIGIKALYAEGVLDVNEDFLGVNFAKDLKIKSFVNEILIA